MKQGDKWGRLTCVEVVDIETPIMADDGKGGEYATGDYDVVNQYKLACECGREVVVDAKDFKGKRKMLDCGCGRGFDDKLVTIFTITVPAALRRRIQAFANDQDMNVSKSVCRLVERGLEDWTPGQAYARKDTDTGVNTQQATQQATQQDSEWR